MRLFNFYDQRIKGGQRIKALNCKMSMGKIICLKSFALKNLLTVFDKS
jgi:hypothetical protein